MYPQFGHYHNLSVQNTGNQSLKKKVCLLLSQLHELSPKIKIKKQRSLPTGEIFLYEETASFMELKEK